MTQQYSDKAPVTFQDVAACFSEEEWKLLHEWQKELYRNVMKEIHQALISLGPLIATSVFSLKANEKEDTYPIEDPDFEKRYSIQNSPGRSAELPVVSFQIKEEVETYPVVYLDSESGESASSPTGFPSLSVEPQARFVPHRGANKGDIHTCSSAGIALAKPVLDLSVKPEEVFQKERENKRRSVQRMILDRKDVESLTCSGKIASSKDFSRKAKEKEVSKSVKEISFKSRLWPERNQELKEDTIPQYTSELRNPQYSNLHMRTLGDESSRMLEYENSLGHVSLLSSQPNTQQPWKLYPCTECDKSFRQYISLVKHRKVHNGKRAYQCSECGKGFRMKNTLVKHKRTHSGERPYHCSECGKSFIQKHHLIGHQRGHTGERPYRCNRCTKCFPWKASLIAHQKTHAGSTGMN
ncbi:zinc finger protein 436-like isoform X2 [Pleurodeles waltl]|uniref:zinc finger protein 436-like isoform X2 n=1 Tax=Pleurodeles waltl TaxID=8319 RepID=UPI0037095A0F